jgi:hypothetical protein
LLCLACTNLSLLLFFLALFSLGTRKLRFGIVYIVYFGTILDFGRRIRIYVNNLRLPDLLLQVNNCGTARAIAPDYTTIVLINQLNGLTLHRHLLAHYLISHPTDLQLVPCILQLIGLALDHLHMDGQQRVVHRIKLYRP